MKEILENVKVFTRRRRQCYDNTLTFSSKTAKLKIVEFANSVDPHEAAHNEPSHLDLHCLTIII